MAKPRVFDYKASPTCSAFHCTKGDHVKYKGIRGPVGSGKSVSCCLDLFLSCNEQEPVQIGARQIRWKKTLVARNTFSMLKNTTIETWLQWFPQTEMHWSPPIKGRLEMPSIHNDGTWIRQDLIFYATDSNTIKTDVMGLELSDAWFNEAYQIDFDIIHLASSRIGRFQPVKGKFLKSFPTIMDTNAPNDSNWWYTKEQVERPDGMEWFIQPPALILTKGKDGGDLYLDNNQENAKKFGIRPAENVENLRDGFGYYRKMLIGAKPDVIKRLVLNQYGTSWDGLPIYHEWNCDIHVKRNLPFMRGLPLHVGWDFGRTPAAVFIQLGNDGILRVLGECTCNGMSIQQFWVEVVRPYMQRRFGWPNCKVMGWADPSGANQGNEFNISCIQVLNAYGMPVKPAPGLKNNDFNVRRDAVGEFMRQNCSGQPAFQVDGDECPELVAGMNGGYCFRRIRTVTGLGEERYADAPDKTNPFTHPQDALQYDVLGATRGDMSGFTAMQGAAGVQGFMNLAVGEDLECV